MVQRDRSRTKQTVAADGFSRISIWFRRPAFKFRGPAFLHTTGRARADRNFVSRGLGVPRINLDVAAKRQAGRGVAAPKSARRLYSRL